MLVLIVIARIPHAIVISIYDETHVILLRFQIIELRHAIHRLHLLHHLILGIKKLHQEWLVVERSDVDQQGAVGIQRVDLEALLDRLGSQSINILKGSRIHLQTVFYIRAPLAPQFISSVSCRQKFHRCPIPEGIMLGIKMDGGSICLCQRSWEGEEDVPVGIQLR